MITDPRVMDRAQFVTEGLLWICAPFVWLLYATSTGIGSHTDWFKSVTVMVPFAYLAGTPILFFLVFGSLPIAHLRRRRRVREDVFFSDYISRRAEDESDEVKAEQEAHNKAKRRLARLHELAQQRALNELARKSKEVADNVRTRAGIFLLGGLLIAVSGVGFFYIQTPRSFTGSETSEILASLAPNFGVLFFIEFVALFLLRQYRPLMDEFRHYEAIQRRREEVAALLYLLDEQDIKVNPLDLAREGHYFSVGELLDDGKTTALLESRKVDRDEAANLWGKLIDALNRVKP